MIPTSTFNSGLRRKLLTDWQSICLEGFILGLAMVDVGVLLGLTTPCTFLFGSSLHEVLSSANRVGGDILRDSFMRKKGAGQDM
jgi:hypothetical protein